jgi:hypothetical protein
VRSAGENGHKKHKTVIRVYDEAGGVVETYEEGKFKEW